MKAIKEATGRTMDKIKSDVQEYGDIGTVAQVWWAGCSLLVYQATMSQSQPSGG
jgi:ATP-dependent DNA ligase